LLLNEIGIEHFINADSIAQGLSPLKPELAAVSAGKLLIKEIDRLVEIRADFAFETTLSGRLHAARLRKLKESGYWIQILFIRLNTPNLSLKRVASRVRQGGHSVPREDILRRFEKGWRNFQEIYRPIADSWVVFDNSSSQPRVVETFP
jgi:predicted ABC-type ATPase